MAYNKAQEEAIRHYLGPMLVLAGPGSGKTHVITKRIEYLIANHKVRPEEILVITFTKYAANEMKNRFQKNNKGQMVTFGTFHGIFYSVLKWAFRIDSSNILGEEEKYKYILEIVSNMEMEVEIDVEEEKDFIASISKGISDVKNNSISCYDYQMEDCPKDVFVAVYEEYEKVRIGNRKIDFDDMIVECHKLFMKRPDLLRQWQERYTHILIDEFQDINQMQYQTIQMLAKPEDNLFIVGDDDQSIYRFRGAKPDIMLGFRKDYRDAKQVVLKTNYRSTKSIVEAASKVIGLNTKRYKKEIETPNEQGDTVHVQEVKDPLEESRYVLNQIQKLISEGVKLEEIAVLFRTNMDARMMAGKMLEYNVPFQMREYLPNIYEHFIAHNIIAYMKLAIKDGQRKDFVEVMNRPNRFISREAVNNKEVTFESIRNFYSDKEWMMDRIDQWELDLRIMNNVAPFAAIQYLRKSVGYDDYLREYAQFRNINIQDLIEVLQEISEQAKAFKTIGDWLDYVEVYTKRLKKQMEERTKTQQGVALHTMHGAKGLEFDYVYIIGGNEGVIPNKKAVLDADIEEERRMFYVAMTRARKKLTIVYPKEKNGKEMNPSRFVTELLS